MKRSLLKNKIFLVFLLALLFFIFIFLKSRAGIIFFGDYNISLWKNTKFLMYPYLWMDNDYGFYFPMLVISFPFQLIFKLLTLFFNINFISNLYHYGAILAFGLSGAYLLKKINRENDFIDYFIIFFFVIGNPLMAVHIFGGIDIIYSLFFVTFFIGYLFNCRRKGYLEFKDIFLLNIIILFINLYILNLVLFFSVLFTYILLFHYKFILRNKLKTLLIIVLFFLLNLFWLINPIYSIIGGIGIEKSIGYSDSMAYDVMNANSKLVKAFSTLSLTPQYVTDPQHYYSFFAKPFVIIPLFIIVIFIFYSLLYRKYIDKNNKIILFLASIFIIFSILTLGIGSPFKNIFLFFWNNIPGFSLFRATVKFQFVTYFALLILLIYSLKIFKNNKKIKIILLTCSIILLSFYFFNDTYNLYNRQYKIPTYYNELEQNLDKRKIISNYKIFPDKYFGSSWAYTAFDWNTNKNDSTNAIILYTKQPLAFQPSSDKASALDNQIRNNLCAEELETIRNIPYLTKILNLLNIKHIIMQNDIIADGITSCFNPIEEYQKESIGKLDLYTINDADFLPHFYIPKNIIISQRSTEELPRILSQDNYNIRSAIFFENQNVSKADKLESLSSSKVESSNNENKLPILEFKKINPTKYRIIIHKASAKFPLVFSESYHEGWKAYLVNQVHKVRKVESSLDEYKILDGNEEDQASSDELKNYIQNGWISTLGSSDFSKKLEGAGEKEIRHMKWNEDKQKEELDYIEKYKIDFISKNFQDTIQNDNLPNGNFWETWMPSSYKVKSEKLSSRFLNFARNDNSIELSEDKHLMANGYANSWIIDTDEICAPSSPQPSPRAGEGESYCVRNADGSYDFEMVVEFWPQRLFYVGAGISLTTLLVCISYLGYDYYKRKKSKWLAPKI